MYLYDEELSEPKYRFLIKRREDAGIKNLDDKSAFFEYSNNNFYFTTILMITIQEEKEKF